MREISPGIFVETDQRGANYGGIVTDDGIIVIDTPMVPKQARGVPRRAARDMRTASPSCI